MLYKNLKIPPNLIERKIISDIKPYLFDDHIIVIIGPRQAGKTSLLYLLAEHLIKEGISHDNLYYFDLEDIDILSYFNSISPTSFASQFDSKAEVFIFIDEVQYLNNPSNLLKIIHDHFPNIKLFVSGSSTLAIKKKFKESLTGRKMVFVLRTLSFDEFLYFRKKTHLMKIKGEIDWKKPKELSSLIIKELSEEFEEFIIFGGYPKVVLEEDRDKKIALLSEIYNSYIKKDIKDLGRVENVEAFNRLVNILAFQVGNMVNLEELTNTLRISRKTVEGYMFLLENTFAIHLIKPYFTNKRKELSKMPKVYFEDTGLRNVVVKNFDPLDLRADSGSIFENAVFSMLIKRLDFLEELKFWRTQAGAEVDFVIDRKDILPYEVKFREIKKLDIPVSLKNFVNTYRINEAVLVNRNLWNMYKENNKRVYFLPGYLL